jgi:hypothetical protein
MRFANWKLKQKIAMSGLRSYEVERIAKLPPTKLSRISNGSTVPSWDEKERIAKALATEVEEIFQIRDYLNA